MNIQPIIDQCVKLVTLSASVREQVEEQIIQYQLKAGLGADTCLQLQASHALETARKLLMQAEIDTQQAKAQLSYATANAAAAPKLASLEPKS